MRIRNPGLKSEMSNADKELNYSFFYLNFLQNRDDDPLDPMDPAAYSDVPRGTWTTGENLLPLGSRESCFRSVLVSM